MHAQFTDFLFCRKIGAYRQKIVMCRKLVKSNDWGVGSKYHTQNIAHRIS